MNLSIQSYRGFFSAEIYLFYAKQTALEEKVIQQQQQLCYMVPIKFMIAQSINIIQGENKNKKNCVAESVLC